jgi:hypothetical protein
MRQVTIRNPVHEVRQRQHSSASELGIRTIYADPRFWRLAPVSALCI